MSTADFLRFPEGHALRELLKLERQVELEDLFRRTLTGPLDALFGRPRKNLRAQLVEVGFRLAGVEGPGILRRTTEILEMLHAGSLVVDDIEDQSPTRRGQPSLHTLYGIPLALNAANWLYFLPFTYIDELPVAEVRKAALTRECVRTLLLAHYGQALDVGVPFTSLPQERVADVVLSAIELKTGVLAGFAMKLGGLIAGSDEASLASAESLGRRLGVALQMFDDIGNLTSSHNPGKRGEDLSAAKLSFLAAVAARTLAPETFASFVAIVQSKNPDRIAAWLGRAGVTASARQQAEAYLLETIDDLAARLLPGGHDIELLKELQERLQRSYD